VVYFFNGSHTLHHGYELHKARDTWRPCFPFFGLFVETSSPEHESTVCTFSIIADESTPTVSSCVLYSFWASTYYHSTLHLFFYPQKGESLQVQDSRRHFKRSKTRITWVNQLVKLVVLPLYPPSPPPMWTACSGTQLPSLWHTSITNISFSSIDGYMQPSCEDGTKIQSNHASGPYWILRIHTGRRWGRQRLVYHHG